METELKLLNDDFLKELLNNYKEMKKGLSAIITYNTWYDKFNNIKGILVLSSKNSEANLLNLPDFDGWLRMCIADVEAEIKRRSEPTEQGISY